MKGVSFLGTMVKDLPTVYPRNFSFSPKFKSNEYIGAEFEIEGVNLPKPEDMKLHWNVKLDDSLRIPNEPGGNAYEYISKRPVSPEVFIDKSFPYLLKKLNTKKSKPRLSNRTSVHIHVGVHELYVYQAMLFAVLYYVFEDLFWALVGEDRDGGLFCVGSKHSDYVVDYIYYTLTNDNFKYCVNGFPASGATGHKYSAVNLMSLGTFGTLEFRAMEGCLDRDRINTWVHILDNIRTYSSKITTPS